MSDPRKLEVWQRARRMSLRVHRLLRNLPPEEPAVRGDQMSRSSSSIPYNISEGKSFDSDPLLAKHLKYALGSAGELQDQLEELSELGLLPARDEDLLPEIDEIRKMVAGFKKRVDRDVAKARRSRKKRGAPKAPRDPNR